MQVEALRWSDELLDEARRTRDQVADALRAEGVPGVVELTGAASVPGALTKGDIDLHLRVAQQDFAAAVARLRTLYPVASPQSWAETLAVFEVPGARPTGLAVTPVGSAHDVRFRRTWQALRRSRDLLREHNRIKQAAFGTDAYEGSKSDFFTAISSQPEEPPAGGMQDETDRRERDSNTMAYFQRVGATTFRATEHTSGAWNVREQHVAPALGLLAHAVEADRDARRDDGLVVARLSYDILGTVPVDVVDVSVRVVRPGRTIELVEATLAHAGRAAVLLRAWLLQPGDTAALAATDVPAIPAAAEMPAWDPTTVWPGAFIESVDVRRQQVAPGRAAFWVRTACPLLDGEPVSPLARAAGLFDIANGMTVRTSPREVAFPNVDLTAHLHAPLRGEWLGFDTTVTFGAGGVGLTASTLHDESGPVGAVSQVLTIRPS